MDTLQCARCARPSAGGRFCTTCGAPLLVASSTPATAAAAGPSTPPAISVLPTVPPDGSAGTTEPPWLAVQPSPTAPRGRPNVLATLVVGALLLSGWAILIGVEQHTVSGSLLVSDSSYDGLEPGDACRGDDGYDDVSAGAQVVIADQDGTTLSTSRLSAGTYDGLGCVFTFELGDVARADFYALTVAGENRGALRYSYDELADGDWSVQLSLGED